MNQYSFKDIEEKWQKVWDSKNMHSPDLIDIKNKFYMLYLVLGISQIFYRPETLVLLKV